MNFSVITDEKLSENCEETLEFCFDSCGNCIRNKNCVEDNLFIMNLFAPETPTVEQRKQFKLQSKGILNPEGFSNPEK